jgi:RNA polymerase sigma-70 factor (ECF subfamily)
MFRRRGMRDQVAGSYTQALALATNESDQRFLERRLREVQAADHRLVTSENRPVAD